MTDIKVIPATKQKTSNETKKEKIKVALYARVSTEKESQLHSLQNQVEYYNKLVLQHDDWIFMGMYYDEGISATNTKKRNGFNDLIDDALKNEIDLIVTKSVTRFARNTIDAISTVRMLSEHNIEVYFEKDNIWTMSGESEFVLTIISAIAQEESHSISENTKWGMRNNMRNGIGCVPFSNFLGYDMGAHGEYVINEEQAEIVRRIYDEYIFGFTIKDICDGLERDNVKTVTGKTKWSSSSIKTILSNEKYKGDCLLQKYYLSDFLSKKLLKNKGELPQYYIANHHDPIVDKETWDLVQKLLERDKPFARACVVEGFYRGLIFCEACSTKCHSMFGVKVAHSTDKYRYIFYKCDRKYKEKCNAPSIHEWALNLIVFDSLSDNCENNYITTIMIQKLIDEIIIISNKELIIKTSSDDEITVDYSKYRDDIRKKVSYWFVKPVFKIDEK